MRGYIETVTRSLRTTSRRGAAERARRVRGRRSTFLPVADEMVARVITF